MESDSEGDVKFFKPFRVSIPALVVDIDMNQAGNIILRSIRTIVVEDDDD
jgi:hypothetical protein